MHLTKLWFKTQRFDAPVFVFIRVLNHNFLSCVILNQSSIKLIWNVHRLEYKVENKPGVDCLFPLLLCSSYWHTTNDACWYFWIFVVSCSDKGRRRSCWGDGNILFTWRGLDTCFIPVSIVVWLFYDVLFIGRNNQIAITIYLFLCGACFSIKFTYENINVLILALCAGD